MSHDSCAASCVVACPAVRALSRPSALRRQGGRARQACSRQLDHLAYCYMLEALQLYIGSHRHRSVFGASRVTRTAVGSCVGVCSVQPAEWRVLYSVLWSTVKVRQKPPRITNAGYHYTLAETSEYLTFLRVYSIQLYVGSCVVCLSLWACAVCVLSVVC